ncbi:ComEA family DNA-binding protein [Mariprofundus ferrooxydans]|uniref:ComEA family DNA-binding protein n=1 Tax=Mariprofundus ferrooxydans TaxID=314344 RepID=UPI00037F79BF|nr:helix-hairpin-helix domain-containing protein [Mariprofundus ferrooxydans]
MQLKRVLLSIFVAAFMAMGSAWAGGLVNLNTATVKELQHVEGIGAITAARIVAYRHEHGQFKNVDDLLQVKGIGKKTLAKVKDELTVEAETNN